MNNERLENFPQDNVDNFDYRQLRTVVVLNPNSTSVRKGWKPYLEDLEDNGFAPDAIIRSERKPEDTIDKLANTLRTGDRLHVAGGDGLANTVTEYMWLREAPEAVIVFSALGNACNAYHATTDRRYAGRPSEALRNGSVEYMYPMRVQIDTDSENLVVPALTIFSVGGIATGAAMLEEEKHRNSRLRQNPHTRLAYEGYLSLFKGLPRIRPLEAADYDGGNECPFVDVFCATSPFAKKFQVDNQITDRHFQWGSIETRRDVIPDMFKLMLGRKATERVPIGQAVSFSLTHSERNNNAMYQVDGEPSPLEKGSRVKIDQPDFNDPTHRPFLVNIAR